MTTQTQNSLLLMLCAFIWGTAFVAQSVGADYLEPFSFTTARSLIAFFFLLGLCAILYWRREKTGAPQPGARPGYRRDLLLGGLCCGTALMLGTNLQQKGIETTASGKAGFITALYIVIVPILGLFLKKKASKGVWVSVALAVAGLYCLCIKEGFSVEPGDVYLFLCSLCFAVQILSIDHFAQKVDGVELSCAQFLMVALESAVAPTSLYEPVFSDGEDSFSVMDQLRDKTSEESWISDMMFRDTVRALSPRERRIIALRYLGGKTQTEVAKEIGISQAQVSRLEKGALCQIREQISNC